MVSYPSKPNRKLTRVVCLPVLAGTLIVASFTGALSPLPFISNSIASAATAAVTYKLVKQDEQIVTSGVRQINYSWVPSDKTKSTEQVHVLQIDLTNPYVQLNAMSGKNGSVTSGLSVGGMVKATGAVAGINGDVFNTGSSSEGAPLGAEVLSGNLIVGPSQIQGMYAFAVTKDKTAVIDQFSFQGSVTAQDGTTFKLSGLNQSSYNLPDKSLSHVNTLYMYTNAWTGAQRPINSSTTPTEALVVNGVVTEIGDGVQISTPIPANGYILRGHKDAAAFIKNSLPVGTKVSSSYNLTSQSTGKVYDQDAFQMVVSGHTILMDGGKAATFSRDISGVSGSANRARTAGAYSKDGKTAYLVTVEEYGAHDGVTLATFQKILTSLGVWKAVNFDGGGSTTMISRPLGNFATELAHPTFYGTTQRAVSNGIGIYTTAPAGATKGIVASGPKTLFIGQQATYSLKAYDTYYNPVDPANLKPTWSLGSAIGAFKDGVLTATKPGTTKLTVRSGAASDTVDVEVVGNAQIAVLTANPNATTLSPGTVISAPIKAQLKDGRTLDVPADSVKWEFKGFNASVSGGQITINSVGKDTATGYAIARYDGYSTMFTLAAGSEKPLEDFENVGYPIGFTGLPAETQGTASVVTGLPGRESSKALQLNYDFTNGTGSRFAYATLNGSAGIALPGTPSALTLDAFGDSSSNWMRAEFKDAKGKQVYATISKTIDWTGWKSLRIDLAGLGMSYPVTLTKLYVVNLEEDQDERALQGTVAFDNLAVQYPASGNVAVKQAQIILTVGKKQATVDGKVKTLDAAPVVVGDTTYLPLRFVADALGGLTDWEGTSKRASVLRGSKLLELWVGGKDLLNTGVRSAAPAAPIMQGGRVLVPVRVISEQLGQKVDWEPKTKTITIH